MEDVDLRSCISYEERPICVPQGSQYRFVKMKELLRNTVKLKTENDAIRSFMNANSEKKIQDELK